MALPIQQLAALGARIAFSLVGGGAGGATEQVVFHLGHAGGDYDAENDTMQPAGADQPAEVIAFKRKEAQTGIGGGLDPRQFTANTETLLVEAAKLAQGAVIQETDAVTRADGSTWNIVAATRDPAGATWLVDIRK